MNDGYRVHTIVFVDLLVRVRGDFLLFWERKGEEMYTKEGLRALPPLGRSSLLIKEEVGVRKKG